MLKGRWATVIISVLGSWQQGMAHSQEHLRIVSVDLCADQYVLKFADPHSVVAVSKDATLDTSLMKALARDVPVVRPSLEDVLLQEPDIVVRSYGGGPGFSGALARLGITVLDLGWASSLTEVGNTIERIGSELGNATLAQQEADQLRAALTAPTDRAEITAIYLTPSGVTAGRSILINEVLEAAGYTNYMTDRGWVELPLERLVSDKPDHVIRAFHDSSRSFQGEWSVGRHTLARELLDDIPDTHIPGSWLACSNWALTDVIETLREHR